MNEDLFARHRAHPHQGVPALLMERVSLALNPRSTLYPKDRSLIEIPARNAHQAVLAAYRQVLTEHAWAVYHLRRISWAKRRVDRAIEILSRHPTETEAQAHLEALAAEEPGVLETHRGIPYLYRLRRDETYPAREEYLTISPALAPNKTRSTVGRFEAKWREQLRLF